MFDKKVYAIVTKGITTYAAHIEECRLKYKFDSAKVVTKAEYREARAGGMQSWGSAETERKLEDSRYNRRYKQKKTVRPA